MLLNEPKINKNIVFLKAKDNEAFNYLSLNDPQLDINFNNGNFSIKYHINNVIFDMTQSNNSTNLILNNAIDSNNNDITNNYPTNINDINELTLLQ